MVAFIKRGLISAVTVILLGISAAVATPLTVKPEEAFHQAFPQVPVESIRPTDIKGLYEVISGTNIYYYHQEKDYLFSGNIFQKDGRNLTGEKRAELEKKQAKLAVEMAKSLPLDKAVKIGNGKTIVIEFTDPDCPYCRNASNYLSKRADLTRYIFFTVLANHPTAIDKIHYILSTDNKAQAYEEMMAGKAIPTAAPAVNEAVKALTQDHLALGKKVGIQATPTFFINDSMVVGAEIKKIEQLLQN